MRFWTIVVLIVACLCSGCGTNKKNDEGFLKNLQSGLEKRWDATNNQPDSYDSTSDYKDALRTYINMELDAIGDLAEYTFEDSELQELANVYVDALQSQLDGVQYYSSDDNQYNEKFVTNGYNKRAEVLKDIVDNFDFSVGSKYQNNLDDFVNVGRMYEKQEKMLEDIQGLITTDLVMTCLGGANYEIKLNNTTEYDLSGAEVMFNLYGSDDSLTGDASTYLDNCKAGGSCIENVYTTKEFDRVEMAISLYNDDTSEYITTEYQEISVENNMIIDIEMITSLPAEISSISYDNTIESTCKVETYTCEDEMWHDGKATITVNLTGEKMYDAEDGSVSGECHIGWKLYDREGSVVDSGTAWTNGVMVGQKFKKCQFCLRDLEPGTYQLELLNVNW